MSTTLQSELLPSSRDWHSDSSLSKYALKFQHALQLYDVPQRDPLPSLLPPSSLLVIFRPPHVLSLLHILNRSGDRNAFHRRLISESPFDFRDDHVVLVLHVTCATKIRLSTLHIVGQSAVRTSLAFLHR
jgi:hypothetical protein